ncbi:hypothetical protein LY76DRAFT_674204 [Colletotrichum caudatum]|nr:hypothetical protein LY76DRAFT_674204 [Colletotrichum caudatum]
MTNGKSSGINGELRRRNQPRRGGGKYKWAMQPHHSIQLQKDWLNLATKLFNADEGDILLTSSEKNEVLSLLAKRISDAYITTPGRAVERTVDTVRKMIEGKRSLGEVDIYTALLRYSLQPPATWSGVEIIEQRLDALRYLERCADGVEEYNLQVMKAMTKTTVVTAKTQLRNDAPGSTMPSTTFTSDTGTTSDNLYNPAALPWTQSKLSLVSPTPPSKKRKAASELPPQKKATLPKKPTSPKKRATPRKKTSQPEAVDISTKRKSAALAQDQTDSPTSSLRRARRNPGTTTECLTGGVDSALLANIFKATEVLDQVAHYEDACVRRVALSTFVADLQKAGWKDLEKSAAQLIKDGDCESREFLARMIVSGSYQLINEALDQEAKPTKTDCGGGPSPGRRGPRILFRSG